MDAKTARSATVVMLYKGEDIAAFCTSFSFTSKAYGEMDQVAITLQDRDGRVWQGERWPTRGDILEPILIVEDWRRNGDRHELRCGAFELDMPVVTGPPDTIELNGSAKKTETSAQAEKKTTGWEAVSLSQVAGDIAGRNGYSLDWRGKDRSYPRLDQKEEGDLAFLERIAQEAGNGVKLHEGRLTVMDVAAMENQAPAFVFNRLQSFAQGPAVVDYRFSSELHDKYKSCRVIWQDTDLGELYVGKFDDPKVPSGEVLKISDKRVTSSGDAEKLAKESLLAKNRPDIIADLTIVGDTRVKGGLTCTLTEFGGFSGKYLIKSAEHSPFDGYKVKLSLQKVK